MDYAAGNFLSAYLTL